MTSEEITIKSLMQLFMWTDEKAFLEIYENLSKTDRIDISKNAYYQDLKSACKISIKLSRQELLKEIIGEIEVKINKLHKTASESYDPGHAEWMEVRTNELKLLANDLTSKLKEDGK